MNVNEVISYIKTGSTKSVCVDRRLLDRYPGIVRDIVIKGNNRLHLEFNTYGYDEGGLIIELLYEDFDALISALEKYLHSNIIEWDNITKSGFYPKIMDGVDYDLSGRHLKQELRNDLIDIPSGWNKKVVLPDYWADIASGKIDV